MTAILKLVKFTPAVDDKSAGNYPAVYLGFPGEDADLEKSISDMLTQLARIIMEGQQKTVSQVSEGRCGGGNTDPLLNLDESAKYIGFKGRASLSVVLSRRSYPFLNTNVIYVGRRPMFRQSALEAWLESRTERGMLSASNTGRQMKRKK